MNPNQHKSQIVFLVFIGLLLVVVASYLFYNGSGLNPFKPKASTTKPNIVFILTDDQSYYDEYYKGQDIEPNVHKYLGTEGTFFSHYFLNIALCCPSRTATLKGQFAHDTQIYENIPPQGGFETFYDNHEESSTIATWLQGAGYKTGLFGKYMNGYPNSSRGGDNYIPPGWDRWFARSGNDSGNACGGKRKGETDEYGSTMNDQGHVGTLGCDTYLVDEIGKQATAYITANKDKPLFLYIAPHPPHLPATPPDIYVQQNLYADAKAPQGADDPAFNTQLTTGPAWIKDQPPIGNVDNMDKAYRDRLRSLHAVDAMVGQVVQTLKDQGILDNTYIFYASDNGFHVGQHRLGMGKNTPYEVDIRVPLYVRGPGVPQGKRVDNLVMNVDLAPTFAELAGVNVPTGQDAPDGRSLAKFLSSSSGQFEWRNTVLLENHGSPDKGKKKKKASIQGINVVNAAEIVPTLDPALIDTNLNPDLTGDHEEPDVSHDTYVQLLDQQAQQKSGKKKKGGGGGGAIEHDPQHPPFTAIRTVIGGVDYSYVEWETGEKELYNLTTDPFQLTNVYNDIKGKSPDMVSQFSAKIPQLESCHGTGCAQNDCIGTCPIADGGGGGIGGGIGGGGATKINLKLKFQGIISEPIGPEKSMQVQVKAVNASGVVSEPAVGTFTADSAGIFSGAVTLNVATGDHYYLLVKGPKHVQKKVCVATPTETAPGTYSCADGAITLASDNSFDFSGVVELVGDLDPQNGIVDSYDISLVRNNLGSKDAKLLSIADLNLDGILDSQDYSLMIASLSIKSDEK